MKKIIKSINRQILLFSSFFSNLETNQHIFAKVNNLVNAFSLLQYFYILHKKISGEHGLSPDIFCYFCNVFFSLWPVVFRTINFGKYSIRVIPSGLSSISEK